MALELAKSRGGVIVNADSAQLYRDIPILSAAPDETERKSAEHRLYGVRDGAEAMSAADWAVLAKAEISEIHRAGRMPILVGGTGLYIRTLLDGIAPIPAIDPAIRSDVRNSDVTDNLARLAKANPDSAAKLGPRDTTRIARALEVVLSTGQSLAYWHNLREGGIEGEVALWPLILLPPRDWLYQRCDERFAAMIEAGAVDEVRRLLDRNLSPALPVMRAIGVREIAAFLRGEMTRAEMLVAGQQATRNYAKRQYTWFAHQPPKEWPRFEEIPDPVRAELVEALSLPLRGEE